MRCLALTLAGVAQLLSVVDPNIFRKLIDGYAFKQGSRPQSEIAPAQRVKSDSVLAPHAEGSGAFRAFLRDELIPEINRRYRTTRERSIIGESLAGLFIVETFLEEHTLFTHYIALDPSVWWNAGALIDSAPARIAAFDHTPRSLFLASSLEPSSSKGSARLAEMLRTSAPRELRVTYDPRPDLTHANIFLNLEVRALTDALH